MADTLDALDALELHSPQVMEELELGVAET